MMLSKEYLLISFCILAQTNFNSEANGSDISRFNDDEIGWTNINEEIDMALNTIWPIFQQKGYTQLHLPDMTEGISLRPLFITYTTQLRLTNGLLFNIDGIKRSDDAWMTYYNKSFHFKANLVIESVEFTYDFLLNIIGIEINGNVGGILYETLVTGDFSINAENANIQLNDFQIASFGNIGVQLNQNSIIQRLSGAIVRPITNLFKDRITTSISDAVRKQLEDLIADINKNDGLQLKKFLKSVLSGLTG